MRHIYSAPTQVVSNAPPLAPFHAITCPGAPNFSLVVVERWTDYAAQDAWEALPGVNEHTIWNWGALAPPAVITAFGPWGVQAGDTLAQAFAKIRANWSPARL